MDMDCKVDFIKKWLQRKYQLQNYFVFGTYTYYC